MFNVFPISNSRLRNFFSMPHLFLSPSLSCGFGPDGLLRQLTKALVEPALDSELNDNRAFANASHLLLVSCRSGRISSI